MKSANKKGAAGPVATVSLRAINRPRKTLRATRSIVLCALVLVLTSCAKSGIKTTSGPDTPSWEISKELSYQYLNTEKRKERLKIAQKGIEYGNMCASSEPNNPACYYWRAVNTGQYYQSKVIGYQNGLKSMIKDCDKINKLDPKYEYGGGYRILGLIYTEVPSVAVKKDSIRKDIDKAYIYLVKSTEIAPNYPENYIALAKTYLEMDDQMQADKNLNKAKKLLTEWKKHPDYKQWKQEIKELSRKTEK